MPKKKSKMGRPKVDDPKKVISLRLSTEDIEKFNKIAEKEGIPLSKWIRKVLEEGSDLTP